MPVVSYKIHVFIVTSPVNCIIYLFLQTSSLRSSRFWAVLAHIYNVHCFYEVQYTIVKHSFSLSHTHTHHTQNNNNNNNNNNNKQQSDVVTYSSYHFFPSSSSTVHLCNSIHTFTAFAALKPTNTCFLSLAN